MTSEGRCILIADDEPTLLKMLAAYLGRLGYSVATADTTEKAWAAVEAAPERFAIVVLDATMAGIGLEALALKMLGASKTLRVLAASGYPMDLSALASEAHGRIEFLQKPFTPQKLAKTVRRMLGAEKENV